MKYEVTSMYTKKALSDALKKLMETKPFSKITVSELIAYCGLNRKTFYYHFEDMRDLLRWTLRQEAIYTFRSFDLEQDYESAVLFVLNYLEQNQHMLNCVYDSVGRDELKLYLCEDFTGIVRSVVAMAETHLNKKIPDDYKKLIIMFFTEALAGIITDWLHGEVKLEKTLAVKYVHDIIKGSLTGIITAE